MGKRGQLPQINSQRWRKGMYGTQDQVAAPETGDVVPPAELLPDSKAMEFWTTHAATLQADRRLKPSTVATFAEVCKLYGWIHTLEDELAQVGILLNDKPHPLFIQLRAVRKEFLAAAQQFCLTPASAARTPATFEDNAPESEEEALYRRIVG